DPILTLTQPPNMAQLVAENLVATRQREVLYGGLDESLGFQARVEAGTLQRLRWFLRDHDRGPFPFWLNRHQGSAWLFEDSLTDQNGYALHTANTFPAAYADTALGRGVSVTGTDYLIGDTQPSGYDSVFNKDEGVLVVDGVPSAPSTDGVDRFIV